MSAVLSIRIKKELKEKMGKYDVDWRSEIEKFIERKIMELEAEERKRRLMELLEKMEEKEEGYASSVVRVERDSL